MRTKIRPVLGRLNGIAVSDVIYCRCFGLMRLQNSLRNVPSCLSPAIVRFLVMDGTEPQLPPNEFWESEPDRLPKPLPTWTSVGQMRSD